VTTQCWESFMNWPLAEGWTCETCGTGPRHEGITSGLIWGYTRGICTCTTCYTQYSMLNENKVRVSTPISQLTEEFKAPARIAWAKYHSDIDAMPPEQWIECGVPADMFVEVGFKSDRVEV